MKISKRKLRQLIKESLTKRIAFANDMIKMGLGPKDLAKSPLHHRDITHKGYDSEDPGSRYRILKQKRAALLNILI